MMAMAMLGALSGWLLRKDESHPIPFSNSELSDDASALSLSSAWLVPTQYFGKQASTLLTASLLTFSKR